jgi:hypothetical protein
LSFGLRKSRAESYLVLDVATLAEAHSLEGTLAVWSGSPATLTDSFAPLIVAGAVATGVAALRGAETGPALRPGAGGSYAAGGQWIRQV